MKKIRKETKKVRDAMLRFSHVSNMVGILPYGFL